MKDNIKEGFFCSTGAKCKYNLNCGYLKDFNFAQERVCIEIKNKESITKKWYECREALEAITVMLNTACKNTECDYDCKNCFIEKIGQKCNNILIKDKKDFDSLKKVYRQQNKGSL